MMWNLILRILIVAVQISEENSDNVTFDRWQIVKKKITNSKVDVTFKGAAEMFKDDIKTL